MKYDYQYTLVAVAASVLLMILEWQRPGYRSRRNRVFNGLLYCNLAAAAADLFTYLTISYPQRYVPAVLYISNIVYLALYGVVGVTFQSYLAALLGEKRFVRSAWIRFAATVAVELLLLVTTPLTRWIFYFDDALVYTHGPLFWVFVLTPVLMCVHVIGLFMLRRKRFSGLQQVTVLTLFVLSVLLALLQQLSPRLDLFHLMCVMDVYMAYIVFENPAYFTYHATRCYNRRAFFEEAERMTEEKRDARLLLVCVTDHRRNHGIRETLQLTALHEAVADALRQRFGRHTYCVARGRFLLMADAAAPADSLRAAVEALFADGVTAMGEKRQPRLLTRSFLFSEAAVSDDFVDHLIETVQLLPAERLCGTEDFAALVLRQHEYRELEDTIAGMTDLSAFRVVYQPIRDVKAGRFRSAEALIRMNGPDGKPVSPELFIPIAEKNGRILQLGEYVLREVCRFWASDERRALGLEFVEVNVSPVQLLEPGMGERFVGIIAGSGVKPEEINL